MRVRLVQTVAPDGADYSCSLGPAGEYEVHGVESDYLRLVNDRGEPILYDPTCFQVTDPTEPDEWVSRVLDGVRYAGPPELMQPGFYEDWHDGMPEVRRRFAEYLTRWPGRPQ